MSGNLEAEIRRGRGDVPIAQRLVQEWPSDSWPPRAARCRPLRPLVEEVCSLDVEEQVRRRRASRASRRRARSADRSVRSGCRSRRTSSQLSPYWSGALHLGHVPLTKRSARNVPAADRRAASTSLLDDQPGSRSAARSRRTARGSRAVACCRSCRTRCRSRRSRGRGPRACRRSAASSLMPSCRARIMIAVPWVSSAQTIDAPLPRSF